MAINLRYAPKSVKVAALAALPDLQGKTLRVCARTRDNTTVQRGKHLTGFTAQVVQP